MLAILHDKPTKLFNTGYSKTKPLYIISEYGADTITYSRPALANKEPRTVSHEDFYKALWNDRSYLIYHI